MEKAEPSSKEMKNYHDECYSTASHFKSLTGSISVCILHELMNIT